MQPGIELIHDFRPIRILANGIAQEFRLRGCPEGRFVKRDFVGQWTMRRQKPGNVRVIAWFSELSKEIIHVVDILFHH